MLKKLQKRNSEGFTIIEVMIVLAIAALILLIVLLAVPALQRNSRNTQRKNDAATTSGLVNEYANNQNGGLPAASCLTVNNTTLTVGGGTCPNPTNSTNGNVSGQFGTVTTQAYTAPGPAASTTTMFIETGATCNGNALAAGTVRQFAVWYAVEPGTVAQCIGS